MLLRPDTALSPHPNAPFRLHQVTQNIVDAGQVAFAFGAQPFEHLRIETDAHRSPWAERRAPHQMRELLFAQPQESCRELWSNGEY